MCVHWERHTRERKPDQNSPRAPTETLIASLVESARVDAKPRRRSIQRCIRQAA
jgi:hypothetical protein